MAGNTPHLWPHSRDYSGYQQPRRSFSAEDLPASLSSSRHSPNHPSLPSYPYHPNPFTPGPSSDPRHVASTVGSLSTHQSQMSSVPPASTAIPYSGIQFPSLVSSSTSVCLPSDMHDYRPLVKGPPLSRTTYSPPSLVSRSSSSPSSHSPFQIKTNVLRKTYGYAPQPSTSSRTYRADPGANWSPGQGAQARPDASSLSKSPGTLSRKKGSASSGGLLSDSTSGTSVQRIDIKRLMSKPMAVGSASGGSVLSVPLSDSDSFDESKPKVDLNTSINRQEQKAPSLVFPSGSGTSSTLGSPASISQEVSSPHSTVRADRSAAADDHRVSDRKSRNVLRRRASGPTSTPNNTGPTSPPMMVLASVGGVSFTIDDTATYRTPKSARQSSNPPLSPIDKAAQLGLTPASALAMAYKEKEQRRAVGDLSSIPHVTRLSDPASRGAKAASLSEGEEDPYATWALAEEKLHTPKPSPTMKGLSRKTSGRLLKPIAKQSTLLSPLPAPLFSPAPALAPAPSHSPSPVPPSQENVFLGAEASNSMTSTSTALSRSVSNVSSPISPTAGSWVSIRPVDDIWHWSPQVSHSTSGLANDDDAEGAKGRILGTPSRVRGKLTKNPPLRERDRDREHEGEETLADPTSGKIWKLVKKLSSGTLKDKSRQQSEEPPVPPLPQDVSIDYQPDISHDLDGLSDQDSAAARTRKNSSKTFVEGLSNLSVHSHSLPSLATDVDSKSSSGRPSPSPTKPASRLQSASQPRGSTSGSRPSTFIPRNGTSFTSPRGSTAMHEDSVRSSSPISSGRASSKFFHKGPFSSPRTSTSSIGEELPPHSKSVYGQQIASPHELYKQEKNKVDSEDTMLTFTLGKSPVHSKKSRRLDSGELEISPPLFPPAPLPTPSRRLVPRGSIERLRSKGLLPPVPANSSMQPASPSVRRPHHTDLVDRSPTTTPKPRRSKSSEIPRGLRMDDSIPPVPSPAIPLSGFQSPDRDLNLVASPESYQFQQPPSPFPPRTSSMAHAFNRSLIKSQPPPIPSRSTRRPMPNLNISSSHLKPNISAVQGGSGSDDDEDATVSSHRESALSHRNANSLSHSMVSVRSVPALARANTVNTQLSPRPRSTSTGNPPVPFTSTAFTFRELPPVPTANVGGLSQQEKESKWEDLLAASDRAGGTIQATVPGFTGLLSDTMTIDDDDSIIL